MTRLHKKVNGKKVYLTAEEEAALRAEWEENKLKREANQYKYNRMQEYPGIPEQLDMLYKDKRDGTNKWFECIDSIKKKYPKPE